MAAASAISRRNRLESSVPAMPMTRSSGTSAARHSACVISSTGFVTTTLTAVGAWAAMAVPTSRITRPFTSASAARLIPGVRGRPAATTMTSAPSTAFIDVAPRQRVVERVIPEACSRSSATASARPGTMSIRTISSASARNAAWCAVVAPTSPAPMITSRANRFGSAPRRGTIGTHRGERRSKVRLIVRAWSVPATAGVGGEPARSSTPSSAAASRADGLMIVPSAT